MSVQSNCICVGIPESASFPLCGTRQSEEDAFTEPFDQFGWTHSYDKKRAADALGVGRTHLVSEGVQMGDVIIHRRPLLVDLLPQLLQFARQGLLVPRILQLALVFS